MRLTEAEFAALVEQALAGIPKSFAPYLKDVVVDVEPLPDRRTCLRMGLRDRRALLGLYHGVPLPDRSVEHSGRLPDRITIYQRNIERVCRTPDDVVTQVRKTVLHEVGHHFGLDEHDLDELGYR
ncbi:MAG TPA: metallopeptidase family protein [Phycisphaerae bacterium]|nr:metallopeptidase family protein [Phycisphaerae bacterium]HNU45810.1 metallopeptidase family protein [Phycisphaerae bacterium]